MKTYKIKIDGEEYNINNHEDADSTIDQLTEQGFVDYGYSVECEIEEGGEYTTCDIVSPHNYQHKILAIVDAEDVDYHEAKLELTLTTQYHNWSHTAADRVKKIIEDNLGKRIEDLDKYDKEDIEKYNNFVISYNRFGELELLTEDLVLSEELEIGL